MTTRHLDLGCGARPRNPYGRDELHGIDLAPRHEPGAFEVRRANLALEPIPYPDDHFDSVSAYDFLEHVPRVLPTADGRDTRFPFVELMNEVWRVLGKAHDLRNRSEYEGDQSVDRRLVSDLLAACALVGKKVQALAPPAL